MLLNVLIGVVGIIIGFLVCFLIKKSEINGLKRENKVFQEKVLELTENLSGKKAKLETMQNLQELLQKDFKNLADEIIKAEQKDLREQNKEALEEKFKPLQRDFDNFKNKVEELNKQGEVKTAELKVQIENLVRESKNIQTTADKLADAIKNNSKSRGDFGELILENLLNQAGLINKRTDAEKGNYITQLKIYDDEAENKIQPDAIVFFPDNKHIVIDSKCPLNNFQNFCSSNDEEEKERELKAFFDSAEGMIEDLSGKYNKLEGLNCPEFKLMFIPLEACASYIYGNSDLLNKAIKKNIIIVCPSTLFATLKIIGKMWENKIKTDNLNEIMKSFQQLYEKILLFVERSREIQQAIREADAAFEGLYTTAEGKGGIFSQIEKLKKYNFVSKNRENLAQECINTNREIDV
ncbi:MAG: DNA recombination protein RmuC [Candidatus Gastranaerophilales bacterium]|nr:DNA recombination protein RmuC [Candidatus Gastranaerophilales bacterium]